MISDIRKDCVDYASRLGDYQKMTVNYLADNYCAYKDAGDTDMASNYIAALILRFWSKIGKMYMQQPTNLGLEMEDFYNWLYDAIELACQYRVWQDTSKHVNAEQAINKCIETTKLRNLYQCRLAKHKMNYNGNYSLDQPVAGGGEDEVVTLGDSLESENDYIEEFMSNRVVYDCIRHYLDKQKIMEAVILSCIAFSDCIRETKETSYVENEDGKKERITKKYQEFWAYKLVRVLNKLSTGYEKAFSENFNVKETELAPVMQKLRTASNQKLYKYIEATLSSARKEMSF